MAMVNLLRQVVVGTVTVVDASGGSVFGNSAAVNLPSAPVLGDVLVAVLNVSQFGGARAAIPPSGWTQQAVSTSGNVRLYVYTHTAGSGESSLTNWGMTGGAEWLAVNILHCRGAAESGFQVVTNGSVTAAGVGLPITGWDQDNGTNNSTVPSGVTQSGWTTDYLNSPPFHETFIGHGPMTSSGDVVNPSVVFNGSPPPPPVPYQYANCVLYPV